jgi:hypothetical protein
MVIPRTSGVRGPNPEFCANYARTVEAWGAEVFEDGCLVTFPMVGVCLGLGMTISCGSDEGSSCSKGSSKTD